MKVFLLLLAAAAGGALEAQPDGIAVPLPSPAPANDADALLGKVAGVVAAVTGTDVEIAVRDPYVPRTGDRVELYETGPGSGTLAGWWSVTYAEGDLVRAKAERSFQAPARGMKATVFSGLPCCMKIAFNLALGLPEDPRVAARDTRNGRPRLRDVEARARKAFGQAQGALAEGNYAAAAPALRQAADLGHEDAAYELFRMYAAGRRGGPDRNEAAKWLRRAAELGKVEAQRDLGWAFEGRFDVLPSDPEKAQAWLRKAAAGGSREAADALKSKR
jgi:hypothetical protein